MGKLICLALVYYKSKLIDLKIHLADQVYQKVPETEDVAESSHEPLIKLEDSNVFALWKEQFVDALTVQYLLLYFRIP